MAETSQQYKARILTQIEGKNPVAVQTATVKKIEKLLAGVSAAKIARRPGPKKWSVGEILAHLADTELVAGYRFRTILGAPGAPIQGFDQDRWAASMNYAKRPHKASLAAFRAFRDHNLALLKSLTPRQLKLQGIHSERGPESVADLLRLMAGHDLNHLQQIKAILG